jgi:hypothetical protein
MKKKTFDWESVFAHIWNHADGDGIWAGDAKMLAGKFQATEDEALGVLTKLCDRALIQRVGASTYIISRWRERDDPGDEELRWWEITLTLRRR